MVFFGHCFIQNAHFLNNKKLHMAQFWQFGDISTHQHHPEKSIDGSYCFNKFTFSSHVECSCRNQYSREAWICILTNIKICSCRNQYLKRSMNLSFDKYKKYAAAEINSYFAQEIWQFHVEIIFCKYEEKKKNEKQLGGRRKEHLVLQMASDTLKYCFQQMCTDLVFFVSILVIMWGISEAVSH